MAVALPAALSDAPTGQESMCPGHQDKLTGLVVGGLYSAAGQIQGIPALLLLVVHEDVDLLAGLQELAQPDALRLGDGEDGMVSYMKCSSSGVGLPQTDLEVP